MRVADYIYKELADRGIRCVFMVSGGGAMHLCDALGRQRRLKYVCNGHEQACVMAAEGYARASGHIGAATVTTGPGGTNTVTGVIGAWIDSIPVVVISGQVKLETTVLRCPGLRQLGDQEINITDIVKPVTKYAEVVTDKNDVAYHLGKALHIATSGRPGPVWLDVPLDVQGSDIDKAALRKFDPSELAPPFDTARAAAAADVLARRINGCRRPVLIVGNGVRLAGAARLLNEAVRRLGMPVLTSISGIDLIESDSPLFFGRPGILGERPANFIIQNCDLLIVVGTRMNLRQIGYAYDKFARGAFKAVVDADSAELRKPTLKPDLAVHADAKFFLEEFMARLDDLKKPLPSWQEWLGYCRSVKSKYPVVLPEHRQMKDRVSSYYFAELLSKHLDGGAMVVTGNGTAYTSTYQAFRIKRGQRMFANVGCASMGYGLPAAIGASFARNRGEVICLTGDGSIQMNLQEMQTILNHDLPIKIFMFNNKGYLSIKITQKAFFRGRFVGSTEESGVKLPDMRKIARAFGYPTERILNNKELRMKLPAVLSAKGPFFCELMMPPFEKLGPKASSKRLDDGRIVSKPLEDLAPFLPRRELLENMIIQPVPEQ